MKKNERSRKSTKPAWPTKEAMEQVYANKLWGDNQSCFYSGEGSHHPELVDPYLAVVTTFLNSFENPLVVCDLGCGDFNVGKELVKHTKNYVAVDIVKDLIDYNKEKFTADNLEFLCLDLAKGGLPSGNCAILRQVLQHLSNAEVQSIVKKLAAYQYVILTEHIPEGDFIANKEIISGQGIRLKKQSGINIIAPPFNLKVVEEKELISVRLKEDKGLIKTKLYKLY